MPVLETERYEINPKPLGRGGFGEVYAARDLLFDRDVVVKTIIASSLYGIDIPQIRRQFFREAAVAARLSFDSPFIVKVYDYGYDQNGNLPFFVQEFITGGDLTKFIGRFSWEQAGKLVSDMLTGLSVAHARGVVHSDVSPDNILIDGNIYKLNDFGLAKLLTSALMSRAPTASLTGGKPTFLPVDHWYTGERNEYSDLYGLAMTVVVLIMGEIPRVRFDERSGQIVMPRWDELLPTSSPDDVIFRRVFDGPSLKESILGVQNPEQDHSWKSQGSWWTHWVELTRGDVIELLSRIFNRQLVQTEVAITFLKSRILDRVTQIEREWRVQQASNRESQREKPVPDGETNE